MIIRDLTKFYFVLIVGFVILIIIGNAIFNVNKYKDIRDEVQIEGIIKRIRTERSSAFVVLKDGRHLFIIDSDNYNYEPNALNKFIKINDLITKNGRSDTLYIYRRNKVYYFLLGEIIRKD